VNRAIARNEQRGGGGDAAKEGEEEDGLEDLLTWSSELDYDAYVANWHVLATSGTSGSDHHSPPRPLRGGRASSPQPQWGALHKQLNAAIGNR
jgi:hypothetical protein